MISHLGPLRSSRILTLFVLLGLLVPAQSCSAQPESESGDSPVMDLGMVELLVLSDERMPESDQRSALENPDASMESLWASFAS